MTIDLSNIEDQPLRFSTEVTLPPDRLEPDRVSGPVSVHLEGTVRAIGDGYRVEGSLDAAGPLTCSRCLDPVDWQVQEHFSVEYRRAEARPRDADLELDEEELEVVFFDGDELDLTDVAAEQVLLALPMRIVCDDDCAGLCPRCGGNRNVRGACTCEPEMDPRWGALRDIAGHFETN